MTVISSDAGEFNVKLRRDALQMMSNALNEVCNGVDIADFAFQTRLGFKRAELQRLLDKARVALTNSNGSTTR